MANSTQVTAGQLPLDTMALHAFVQEITEAIEHVALAALWGPNSTLAWSQPFQNAGAEASRCVPPVRDGEFERCKVDVGDGYTAFHFPLICKNIEGCVFTLVIYSVDPPDLRSVSFAIDSVLTCLARQIDVDCMLSTTKLVAEASPATGEFSRALDAVAHAEDLQQALSALVAACKSEHSLEGVAIALPARRLLAISDSSRFSGSLVKMLLAKLQAPLEKQRRVISATISLSDGHDGFLVAAPIIRNRKSIEGITFVVGTEADPALSSLVRAVANRLSTVAAATASQPVPLTRFELIARMDEVLAAQPTLPHSFMYFDMDKMHTVNDAFGFSGGDRALATFRRILLDSAGANDSIGHLGSDRFAMFLPGASGDTAVSKAMQILRFLHQEVIDDGKKSINLSASAGIVDTEAATHGAEDMLILAEVASRGAQDRGGNQCALFQDIDSSIIQRRSDVDKVGFVQMALIENQFQLHAQRIQPITLESGQKFELLARLNCDDAQSRSPAEFLSAAERYQLMAALDRWVINSALASIAGAESSLEVNLSTFSINVSAQSLQDSSFVDFVESRIAETGVAPDTLCFELTETSLVRYLDRAERFVHRLQRLGCQVALDDFGTGYSSFAYLKTLPVNYLKIDGAFVRDLLESDLSKAIVESVVKIADVIGAQTVAEHVENPMVQSWLKQAGVHFVQGFAVHRPEPFDGLLAKMDASECLFPDDTNLDLRLDTQAYPTLAKPMI